MKPYLVNKTWIDLDRIQVMDDAPSSPRGSIAIGGYVTMAFQSDAYWVQLGTLRYIKEANGYVNDLREGITETDAKATWEAFKTAWKTKDTMLHDKA